MEILIFCLIWFYLLQILVVIPLLILDEDQSVFETKKDLITNLIPFYYTKYVFKKLITNFNNLGE